MEKRIEAAEIAEVAEEEKKRIRAGDQEARRSGRRGR
jgi:hypothetical protein